VLNNAKTLRTNQTKAEQRLWYHLRAHRFMDLKFKRQKPMGRYIVDFVCVERHLIILNSSVAPRRARSTRRKTTGYFKIKTHHLGERAKLYNPLN
jgi:hypothetical protein